MRRNQHLLADSFSRRVSLCVSSSSHACPLGHHFPDVRLLGSDKRIRACSSNIELRASTDASAASVWDGPLFSVGPLFFFFLTEYSITRHVSAVTKASHCALV